MLVPRRTLLAGAVLAPFAITRAHGETVLCARATSAVTTAR